MPAARLTSGQLEKVLSRSGYGIAGGTVAKPCLPGKNSNTDPLPELECYPDGRALAKGEDKKESAGRFLVRIKVFRKRFIDPDNVSLKYAIDCLRYGGILPDDRAEDIKLEISEQIKVKTDEEERIEIEIYGPGSLEAKQAEQR